MPRIQTYDQQVETQGPTGGVSPNLELATATGRAVENLGRSVDAVGGALEKRESQEEQSSVFAQLATNHANWSAEINKRTANGTLDVDEFKQEYEDSVNKIGDDLSTDAGGNAFKRESARFGSALLQQAAAGKAALAGEEARGNFETALNENSNALYQNPSAFDATRASMESYINSQVSQGLIPAKKADELKDQVDRGLSQSALRGFMQVNPDAAKSLLDNGNFDQYIKGQDKYKMYEEVKQFQRGAEIEKKRQQTALDDAQSARAEEWKNTSAIPQLVSGALQPKAVMNNPDLNSDEKLKWLNLIDARAKKESNGDPAVENNIMKRMFLPDGDPQKISSVEQMEPYAAKGLISFPKMEQYSAYLQKKSPEAQAMNSQRKMFMDYAKGKLVNANPMLGTKDPDGELNFNNLMSEVMKTEQSYRKAGKDPSELFDQKNPNSVWNKVPGFVKTPQQIMQGMADQVRAPNAPPEEMVSVVSPEGVPGKVPKSKVDDYINNRKFKRAK